MKSQISRTNLEFLKKAPKVYFVALEGELDAEATKSEVIYTGVGKARVTRALLKYYNSHREQFLHGETPLIVNIGTAGSGKYDRGEIILCDRFVNNGDAFIIEEISCAAYPEPTGNVCASSDFFISDKTFSPEKVVEMRKKYDCMDMEAFALANACRELGIRFCAVKCISDGTDGTVLDFDKELPKFKEKLNGFTRNLDL